MTTSTTASNGQDVNDDVGDLLAPERRAFMQQIGLAVLTLHCLPLAAQISGHPTGDGKEAVDNLIIHSSPGLFHHVHDLLVPYAVLKEPPLQGVELATTEAMLHRHNIVLTREELIAVNRGGTVTRKASSHLLVIALPSSTVSSRVR